jgi:CDP-6-deoxy-D-xylo-4-hexulose-3-dehydrase
MKLPKPDKFNPGKTYIPSSGKIFDGKEINNAIQAAKDGWWTEGRFTQEFERKFSKYLGVKYISLANSGSSANLLAVAALTANTLGDRKLKPGDEFITSPVAFPTTVNPGIFYGLKPVFVDVKLDTLNINEEAIEKAITPKTKLIMIAHTLGKPAALEKILKLAGKYHLWFIEDCCDALGSKYNKKFVGTFGDIATFSFYPAHQITMGEGGAVITGNPLVHRAVRQFRDWGRDCWCPTGKDNTCRKRFSWKIGDLPAGYDHKYIYSQIGFNLKLTDFQAAIGLAQLEKLPGFIKKRKDNFKFFYGFFRKYEKYFILPKVDPIEDPCWFGFPMIVKNEAPFTRNQITRYFEEKNIGTRAVFSGNITKHPAYRNTKYRTFGNLNNADLILTNAFWIGVYPGIGKPQLQYIAETFISFLKRIE